MSQKILDALKALDVNNDNHWTADGLPRLDTVKMLAADPTLSREAVTTAAPGFTRPLASGYTLPAPDSAGNGVQAAPVLAAPPAAAPPAPAPSPPVVSLLGGEGAGPFPDDKTEPAEVVSTGVATDEVASMETELEETRVQIRDLQKGIEEATKFLAGLMKKEDELAAKLVVLKPADNTPSAIRAYLNAQVQRGLERQARQQLIKDSGLDLKELGRSLKSPLDASMQRKTARGTQRPVMAKG